MLRRKRGPKLTLPRADLATAWQLVSLLLDYPDEALVQREPLLRQAAAGLPAAVGQPLLAFLDELAGHDATSLRADYVQVFDTSRRCCLYLSYFTHGDTRKRGMALVEFKQAYRKAGVEFDADELPDHLSVVLEFGACYDLDTTWRLLNEHRAGIEVLARALHDRDAPWQHVVRALLATLPPMAGDDEARLLKLINEGPPQEDVGLDSTTPYLIDPSITGHLRSGAVTGPIPVSLSPTRSAAQSAEASTAGVSS